MMSNNLRALIVLLLLPPVVALAQGTTPARAIHFDVVSIKENISGEERGLLNIEPAGHRIIATNVPMFRLIGFAYGKQRNDLVAGLPDWARTQRWDLQATIAEDSVAAFQALDFAHQAALLQDILRDRCALQAHVGKKNVPVYALVVAKSGRELKRSPPQPNEPDGWDITQTNGHLHGHDVPIEALLYMLSKVNLDRQVVDRTGLHARYDFDLTFTPDDLVDLAATTSEGSRPPSLFTALEEQLGLRLAPTRADVDAVIVDHIERPTPN